MDRAEVALQVDRAAAAQPAIPEEIPGQEMPVELAWAVVEALAVVLPARQALAERRAAPAAKPVSKATGLRRPNALPDGRRAAAGLARSSSQLVGERQGN